MKTFAGAVGEESAVNVPRRFVETEYSLMCSGAPEYAIERNDGWRRDPFALEEIG
jgi:hypothetical protein